MAARIQGLIKIKLNDLVDVPLNSASATSNSFKSMQQKQF